MMLQQHSVMTDNGKLAVKQNVFFFLQKQSATLTKTFLCIFQYPVGSCNTNNTQTHQAVQEECSVLQQKCACALSVHSAKNVKALRVAMQ